MENPIEKLLGVCMAMEYWNAGCGREARSTCICPKKNSRKRKAGRSEEDEIQTLMNRMREEREWRRETHLAYACTCRIVS